MFCLPKTAWPPTLREAYDIQPTFHYRDLQYIHECQASFKSLIVIEEDRSGLSLTHLLVAGARPARGSSSWPHATSGSWSASARRSRGSG